MATCYMTMLKFALHIFISISCYANICYHDDDKGLNEDSVYNKDYFCCDFYERIGMACVECAVGFKSTKGEPCKPCSRKSYGYRCADKCHSCTRCNHVHGCLHTSTTEGEQMSNLEFNATTINEIFYTQTATTVDKYEILLKRVAFAVCIGCACILVLVISGIYFFKRRKDNTPEILNRHVQSTTMQHQTDNRIESIYDEIEDMPLHEPAQHHSLNTDNQELNSNSSSSVDKNSISNHEDQYLNPYQVIVQEDEDRPYRFIGRNNTEFGNITNACESVRRNQYQVEQDRNQNRQVLEQVQSNFLNYPEIQIINNRDINNVEKYKNTEIFPRHIIQNPCSTENTEYVEIVHSV